MAPALIQPRLRIPESSIQILPEERGDWLRYWIAVTGEGENWKALLSVVDRLSDHYFNHYEETIRPTPLINGGYLLSEFDLEPGPDIGWLLGIVEEAQAAGNINSVAEAKTLIASTLASKNAAR